MQWSQGHNGRGVTMVAGLQWSQDRKGRMVAKKAKVAKDKGNEEYRILKQVIPAKQSEEGTRNRLR